MTSDGEIGLAERERFEGSDADRMGPSGDAGTGILPSAASCAPIGVPGVAAAGVRVGCESMILTCTYTRRVAPELCRSFGTTLRYHRNGTDVSVELKQVSKVACHIHS